MRRPRRIEDKDKSWDGGTGDTDPVRVGSIQSHEVESAQLGKSRNIASLDSAKSCCGVTTSLLFPPRLDGYSSGRVAILGSLFFYSRNRLDHPDEWFKRDDSDSPVVSKGEVLTDTVGSTANPYFVRGWKLIYRTL